MKDDVLPHAPWEQPMTRAQLDEAIADAEARVEEARESGSTLRLRQASKAAIALKARKAGDLIARTDSATGEVLSPGAALRREIAGNRGLPLAFADRLTGESREELEADADRLAASFSRKPDFTTP